MAAVPGAVETAVADGDRTHKIAGNCHVCIDGVESEALLFLLENDERLRLGRVLVRQRGPGAVARARRDGRAPADRRSGSLRLSLGHATTDADVDRVLDVLPTGGRAAAALRVMKPPVLVAMSGGVDSSVAAALLVERGHDVTGVTMKLWGGESDTGCCSVADVDDARRVADQLGIEHHVFNFGDDFEDRVIGPYVAEHAAGRTPNPCIECNRHIKFDKLLRRATGSGST